MSTLWCDSTAQIKQRSTQRIDGRGVIVSGERRDVFVQFNLHSMMYKKQHNLNIDRYVFSLVVLIALKKVLYVMYLSALECSVVYDRDIRLPAISGAVEAFL